MNSKMRFWVQTTLSLVLVHAFHSLALAATPPRVLQQELPQPKLIAMLPGQTFIPPGFDNNDRAEIVVTGAYPNNCYKQGPSEVKIDEAKKRILVTNYAYHYDQTICLQMIVPYQETIKVGILGTGNYTVVAADSARNEHTLGMLPVADAPSKASPDELLYASVEQLFVETSSPTPTLTLSGKLSGTCAQLDEVRVLYRASNVIEVLPIVTMRTAPDCQPELQPFETHVQLTPKGKGSTLIYVRSLDGKAVSRVIDL